MDRQTLDQLMSEFKDFVGNETEDLEYKDKLVYLKAAIRHLEAQVNNEDDLEETDEDDEDNFLDDAPEDDDED